MLVVGHRANSMRVALAYKLLGVKSVEVDVYKDSGGLVAKHGPPSTRRATIFGRIFSAIDYKLFYRDPLVGASRLSEWLEKLWGMGFETVMLDMKNVEDPAMLAKEVEKAWQGEIIISSWNHMFLANAREYGFRVYATYSILPAKPVATALEAGVHGVSISYDIARVEGVVDSFKGAGLDVAVWTINSALQAQASCRMGVDAVISDRPDIVFKALKKC